MIECRSPLFPASGPGLAAAPCGAIRARRAGARRALGTPWALGEQAAPRPARTCCRGRRRDGRGQRWQGLPEARVFPASVRGLPSTPSGAIRARRAGARHASAMRQAFAETAAARIGEDRDAGWQANSDARAFPASGHGLAAAPSGAIRARRAGARRAAPRPNGAHAPVPSFCSKYAGTAARHEEARP